MNVSLVTPDTLPQVWAALLPEIGRAMRGTAGRTGAAAYYECVRTGQMIMAVMHEGGTVVAGAIVSVQEYPEEKIVFLELLVGREMNEWLPIAEPLLRQYKRQVGATKIEALCRPGFTKKLTGWKQKAVLMELK